MLEFNAKEVKEILNKDKYYSRTFKTTGKNYKNTLNKIYKFKQEIKNKYEFFIDIVKWKNDIVEIILDIEER